MHDGQRARDLALAHRPADLETADIRQMHVQHHGGDIAQRQIQRLLSRAGFDGAKSGRAQRAGGGIAGDGIVVDHQHGVLGSVDADVKPGGSGHKA
ncbi:hypothetical protein D3C71_1957070 [compost metagenome]